MDHREMREMRARRKRRQWRPWRQRMQREGYGGGMQGEDEEKDGVAVRWAQALEGLDGGIAVGGVRV